jgi:beta-fructofuranosidase
MQNLVETGSASQHAQTAQALRERLAHDPHRPQYHFLPPANWMNDPNGLIHWKGDYHLFYQYNPNGPFWGTMHWGHAVSMDLVHWIDLPVALAPTPGSADEDGCFSGCVVDNNGIPTLIYTGVLGNMQLPCLATSTDDLLTWEKYAGNPVITAPPLNLDLVGFRDHHVWQEGDTWYQVVGCGINGVGGAALLYTSPDLIHWEYMHPLCVGDKHRIDPIWTGPMWECPDFFPLGDKHVLIVSIWDSGRTLYAAYFVGTYADHKFTPELEGKLDFGDNYFYAPQTLLDNQGRRIMWGWIQEGRAAETQLAAGWSGVMSLPRMLSLSPSGAWRIEPASELEMLRGQHYRWAGIELTPTSAYVLEGVQGDALEIIAEWEAGNATAFGIKVRCAPDHAEQTLITYDRMEQRLSIDREHSSLSSMVQRDSRGGSLELATGETLKLHIFLDRSVIEVFANNRACLTSRIYPSRSDSLGVGLFARGGSVQLKSMDIWEVRSIWTGRG